MPCYPASRNAHLTDHSATIFAHLNTRLLALISIRVTGVIHEFCFCPTLYVIDPFGCLLHPIIWKCWQDSALMKPYEVRAFELIDLTSSGHVSVHLVFRIVYQGKLSLKFSW